MNELQPLLDETDNGRLRALLEAGRADAPPNEFQGRLLLSLGLGAAMIGGVSSAAAASVGKSALGPAAAAATLAPSAAIVVGKWLVVGACCGGLLAGGAELLTAPSALPAPIRSSVPPRTSLPREPATPAANPNATEQVDPLPPLEPKSEPLPTTSAAAQRVSEVELIDAARRALAKGQFRQALAELDRYDQSAKPGVLSREARVVRIEALHRAGQTERARSLAEQYLREFPQDAHAARLRSLTSTTETN